MRSHRWKGLRAAGTGVEGGRVQADPLRACRVSVRGRRVPHRVSACGQALEGFEGHSLPHEDSPQWD